MDKRNQVAIIGMSCRFPEARSIEAFWSLLTSAKSVSATQSKRFSDQAKPFVGIDDVDKFDAEFFNISAKEARGMDPQQRLLLEVTWEALEDAGIVPSSLAGSYSAVFMGITNYEYAAENFAELQKQNCPPTGISQALAANRISYYFDLHGPSFTIDSACSSSLVAVDRAYRSIISGEATLAIVGGASCIFSENISERFQQFGFLSPSNQCRSFAAGADGFVRGEGVGVVILKSLSQAVADDDRIYSVIAGSAINQDGRSNGLTAPNMRAQKELLTLAYQSSNISPAEVQYIEAHGSGTKLGDPIEFAALTEVLSSGRNAKTGCTVGSVKTNVGHLEAAAGIAGLIKTSLCIYHRQLVPSLHFDKPNPYINFSNTPLQIQQVLAEWQHKKLIAGVSAFGFGGTNAHVVLVNSKHTPQKHKKLTANILTLSAKTQAALQQHINNFKGLLAGNVDVELADLSYTMNVCREHFKFRKAFVFENSKDLLNQLADFRPSNKSEGAELNNLMWCFTDIYDDFIKMAQNIFANWHCFRLTANTLFAELVSEKYSAEVSFFDGQLPVSLMYFIFQYTLARVWIDLGVLPKVLMGAGVGKIVVDCLLDSVSLEAAFEAACACQVKSFNIEPEFIVYKKNVLNSIPLETVRDSVAGVLNFSKGDCLELNDMQNMRRFQLISNDGELLNQLKVLGLLYEHRQKINWAVYYRGKVFYKLSLPHYPFQSESYLIDEAVKHDSQLPLFYQIAWQPLSEPEVNRTDFQLEAVEEIAELQRYFITDYSRHTRLLNELSVYYISSALIKLGWDNLIGKHYDIYVLAELLGVNRKYFQLLFRYLDILAAKGIVSKKNNGWYIKRVIVLDQLIIENKNLLQDALVKPAMDLVSLLGQQLANILQAKLDPLTIMFPQGDLTQVSAINSQLAITKFSNLLVAQSVQQIIQKKSISSDTIKILEIGAGTGATTQYLLPLLANKNVEYVFTDISLAFLHAAKIKFANYDFVKFKLLNIDQSPQQQDFDFHQYDIVVAANVLHATKNINKTLQHVVSLLSMSGELVLFELLGGQVWLDVTFALLDGWWGFADDEARSDYPLMTFEQWQSSLQQHGFSSISNIVDHCGLDIDISASVISATKAEHCGETFCLVISENQELANQFQLLLMRYCQQAVVLLSGDCYQKVDDYLFYLNFNEKNDFMRVFAEIPQLSTSLTHVIDMRCLAKNAYYAEQAADKMVILNELSSSCAWILAIIGAIADSEFQKIPKIILMKKTPSDDDIAEIFPAYLFRQVGVGMLNVINQEHPEFKCVSIDIEDESERQLIFKHVLSVMYNYQGESWLALKGHKIWSARLVVDSELEQASLVNRETIVVTKQADMQTCSLASKSLQHREISCDKNLNTLAQNFLTFKSQAAYLITGGLGGLGLVVAEWMIQRGAKHIYLVGRSELSHQRHNKIQELSKTGTVVKVVQCDISDEKSVAELIAAINIDKTFLAGIIHAAGVLDNGVLLNQTWAKFSNVLAPKILGAWYLHKYTRDKNLDFFVMFSSIASLLGLAGQSNHAAANYFLDRLAYYRRAQGLMALSINWTAWAKIGAGQDADLLWPGLVKINPDVGLYALEQAILHDRTQVGVVPMEWHKWPKWMAVNKFYEELVLKKPIALSNKTIKQQLQDLPVGNRYEYLTSYVIALLKDTLGIEQKADFDMNKGFFEMGMDSLLLATLCNRLQKDWTCRVPVSVLFNFPSGRQLLEYLVNEVIGIDVHVGNSMVSEQRNSNCSSKEVNVDDLTNEEAAELLRQELDMQ